MLISILLISVLMRMLLTKSIRVWYNKFNIFIGNAIKYIKEKA